MEEIGRILSKYLSFKSTTAKQKNNSLFFSVNNWT